MIYKKSWKYILVKCNYLYRPKALKNFSDVSKDDIGGHLEGYYNLSQSENCWVYDKARVIGNAKIFENAKIYDYATVKENAKVYGLAKISNNALIKDDAQVFGNAHIYGNAKVIKKAVVSGNTKISGYTQICGQVIGDTTIFRKSY